MFSSGWSCGASRLGENLFRSRLTGTKNLKRLGVAALLLLLAPLGLYISALLLLVLVVALLVALAAWESPLSLRGVREAPLPGFEPRFPD